jgi:hypothetical protein
MKAEEARSLPTLLSQMRFWLMPVGARSRGRVPKVKSFAHADSESANAMN